MVILTILGGLREIVQKGGKKCVTGLREGIL